MSRRTFARTHHISSNYDIQLDGDHARVRVHLTAVHVPLRDEPARHFVIGGHYEAEAVRTEPGWRIVGSTSIWRGMMASRLGPRPRPDRRAHGRRCQ